MKLTTIWTAPAMSVGERLRRTGEWSVQKIARALPGRIRYWVALQQIADATMTSPNVPATPVSEVLHGLKGGPR